MRLDRNESEPLRESEKQGVEESATTQEAGQMNQAGASSVPEERSQKANASPASETSDPEQETFGYAGAVAPWIRKTKEEEPEETEQTSFEEQQREYALKRQNKRRVVFAALPVVAILIVVLLSFKQSKLLVNEPESVISDESVESAQVIDLDASQAAAFEGMDETMSQYVRDVVCLVNERRLEADLPPLELEERLRSAAQTRAEEAARDFSHTRPDGSSYRTAMTRAGLQSGLTGENIGTGFQTPESFVDELMKSESHRAYLMSQEYHYIGVGVVENPTSAKYQGMTFCQLFAR